MSGNSSQRGSILVFTLVTLAVMSTVAFVMAALLFREAQLGRTVDDSLQTWYAAESGVERSLDLLAAGRSANDSLSSTLSSISSVATSGVPYVMPNSGAEYYIDSSTSSSVNSLETILLEFPATQIELYDPDSTFTLMNAESMQVLWNHPSCGASSRIEVTYNEFVGTSFGLTDDSVRKDVYTCGVETPAIGWDCQATSNTPAPNTNYVVRIRALDCFILGANITFYDADNALGGGGSVVPIPSRASVQVVGSGRQTERRFSYVSKWLPSASSLGDFGLFSETLITK